MSDYTGAVSLVVGHAKATRTGAKGVERYANSLERRAADATAEGRLGEADQFLELAWVHRAAAVSLRSSRRVRWWHRLRP